MQRKVEKIVSVRFVLCLLVFGVGGLNPVMGQEENEEQTDLLSHRSDRARVIREFLPNTGPASIAVALPHTSNHRQAYCFDSGICRLRYAWAGGFIDLSYKKKDGPADIEGSVYYRATSGFPIRFGEPSNEPEDVEFLGYHLKNGRPVFRYRVEGVTIHHRIRQRDEGLGLIQQFQLDNPSETVYFVVTSEDNLTFRSDDGQFEEGQLALQPDEAKAFSVRVLVDKDPKKKEDSSK